MKKIIAMLLTLTALLSLMACASGNETAPEASENAPAYADSLEIMNLIWDNTPENGKFACFGGNQTENASMDAPGSFDISDADGMTYMLLIPASAQKNIDNAASLVHMMNANTFTGATVHVSGAEVADVAEAIKTNVLGNQFMCGFPDQLVIFTTGNYVIYAFGHTEQIDNFKTAVTEQIEGATVYCEELLT